MKRKRRLQVGGELSDIELEVTLVKIVKSPQTWIAEVLVTTTVTIMAVVAAEVLIIPMFG